MRRRADGQITETFSNRPTQRPVMFGGRRVRRSFARFRPTRHRPINYRESQVSTIPPLPHGSLIPAANPV
jgi:hypothetical protein